MAKWRVRTKNGMKRTTAKRSEKAIYTRKKNGKAICTKKKTGRKKMNGMASYMKKKTGSWRKNGKWNGAGIYKKTRKNGRTNRIEIYNKMTDCCCMNKRVHLSSF